MDANKAKAIRCYLGMSQKAFGQQIGVATSTICALERGQRGISDYVRGRLVRIEAGLPDDFIIFYDKFKINL